MLSRVLVTFGMIAVVSFFPCSSVFAQAKDISSIMEDQNKSGGGMKSRSFAKPKPSAEESTTSDDEPSYTEEKTDDGMKKASTIPAEKQEPPEEDVWEKYKSIAAGVDKKPLGTREFSNEKRLTFRKPQQAQELQEEQEDAPTKEPEKKKNMMTGLIDDYAKKQKNMGHMNNETFNK